MTGIDWAWGQVPDAVLDAAGVTFACRYLSGADHSKVITRAEADRHLAAGRSVVLVYEDAAAAILGGRNAGARHAATADAQARAAGLPGAVIYFACDYDAPERDQPVISAYLDGAASVISRDRTGLYGGYWPLSRARAARKAAWFWGTRAWSGTNWDPARNPDVWKPHIFQGSAVTIGGVSCDWDTANAGDFGQWPRPGQPQPATGWTETLVNSLPALQQGNRDHPGTVQFVHRLQALIRVVGDINHLPGASAVKADGNFGQSTWLGVLAIQKFFGLTEDGVVGPATWKAVIAGQRG